MQPIHIQRELRCLCTHDQIQCLWLCLLQLWYPAHCIWQKCWHQVALCRLYHCREDQWCNWQLCWLAVFCQEQWWLFLVPRNSTLAQKYQLWSVWYSQCSLLCFLLCLVQHSLLVVQDSLSTDTHLLNCRGMFVPIDGWHTKCCLDWDQWISLCWYPTKFGPHWLLANYCRWCCEVPRCILQDPLRQCSQYFVWQRLEFCLAVGWKNQNMLLWPTSIDHMHTLSLLILYLPLVVVLSTQSKQASHWRFRW